VGRGTAKELLKISAGEQDFEQARALEVVQVFAAERNEERAIGTLVEERKRGAHFGRSEGAAPDQSFELLQLLVASGEEMIETNLLPANADDGGVGATTGIAR
jgi:hypothetical protein